MFKLFSKNHFAALLALLAFNTMNSSLMADEFYYPCECNRLYVGAFGGGIYSNSTNLTQRGTAFFSEVTSFGPLAVDARGRSNTTSSGFGGAQIGYEWLQSPLEIGCSDWSITPAAELEAYFYSHTKRGLLINPISLLEVHDFVDTFPMDIGVFLLNGVFALNNCNFREFSPYVGGGIGVARINIRNADSLQVDPLEAGVNHFDSDSSDSTWAFAAQVKAGLRYNICEQFHIFGEYRFSFVDASRYIFGSTIAPGHVHTTTWLVDVNSICYNAFAIGIQYDF